jgi:hypothetical protein
MSKLRVPLEGFNDAKLADLTEPITVTVHKIMNGRPCPITLPVKPEEDIPGKGWTFDEVKQLDQVLVELISGGGEYHNTATGDNGAQMRWRAYFPVDRYPEKGAVTSQPPAGNGNGRATQLDGPPQVVMAPQVSAPNYAPPHGWMQAAAATMYAQQQPRLQQMQQPQVVHAPQQWPQPQMPPQIDARLQEEREARLQLEAKIERERLENHYKEQLGAMQQEMRRIQEQMQLQQVRPAGESPAEATLRAELAEMRKERDSDKFAATIRELQQTTQMQLAAQAQATQQQIAALTALIQQKPAGPDPFMMLMIESQKEQAKAQLEIARLQADAQKEAARLQVESQKESARNAIGPREMMDIIQKSGQGHEVLANGYTRLMELSTQHVENMLNAQGPQTHPALEMAAQGVQGVLGVAQRYIEAKEKSVMHQAQAVAIQAQAGAQAQIATAAARSGQLAAPAPVAPAPAPVQPEVEDDGEDDGEDEAVSEMEQELFGDALSSVERLRKGVASEQITPEQAANAIVQGIDYYLKKEEVIPAFALWQQREIGKFVDILIPDAPPSFKDQMAGHLFEARKKFK